MYQKIEKMIRDLELRGRSKNTINNMVCTMKAFSRFYNQPTQKANNTDNARTITAKDVTGAGNELNSGKVSKTSIINKSNS